MISNVMSPRLRKLLRWSLGVAIGFIVLLTAAVMIAERMIDTPKVRAQLAEKLSSLLNGKVAWEGLEIRMLPLPHGVVRNAHVAIPNIVTVDVATVDVKINLVPLFHGSAEVQAITLESPSVDVWVSASPDDEKEKKESSRPTNVLALYRSAMRPVLDAVARFAPETTIAISGGRVALHLFELPTYEMSKLDLKVVTDEKGVAVNASAAGTYWDNVAIDGRVEFADLRALVKLECAGLKPQAALEEILTDIRKSLVLSNITAKFEASTDGRTDIGIALDLNLPRAEIQRRGKQLEIVQVRLAGSIKFIQEDIAIALDEVHLGELAPAAKVSFKLTGPNHAPTLDIDVGELDLARLRDAAVTLAGDQPAVMEYVARIRGGKLREASFSAQADSFGELFALSRLRAGANLVDASYQIPTLEREASKITARAELLGGAIKVSDVAAQIGASRLRQAGVDIILLEPMRIERTRGQISLVLHDLLPGLRAREPFTEILKSVPPLKGVAETNVRNVALRFDKPSQVTYDISVRPQHIRIATDQLPAPADVHGGAVRITPQAIRADRVGVALLDSKATVSAEVTDYQNGHPRVTARVADGVAERKLIDWLWQRTELPERLKPVPLRFGAQRVQWSDAALDVVADASVNAGARLSVDLSTRGETFTLHRATIKDRDSDANITFATHDSLVEVGFAGVLAVRSLAPLLGHPADSYPGSVKGDVQATFDLKRRGRSMAQGKLAGERLNLRNLTGTPLKLERFDLQGEGKALQIHELTVDWEEQKATIRGTIAHQANELAMTLDIDSPGIVIDALRGTSTPAPAPVPNTNAASAPSGTQDKPSKSFDLWSLPLRGTVSLRTDFVEYEHYRVQGIRAAATLEQELATLDLTEASLCGIAFPLSLRVTPKNFDASVNVSAKAQSLGGVAECLGGTNVIITGTFDLASKLSAKGPMQRSGESVIKDISGSMEFSTKDGEIRKMALLGNILSLKSVSQLLKGDVGLGGKGFKYRSIALGAKIKEGEITLEQAALDSSALGLAATGKINLENYDSRLTVLVAPFGTLDRIARKIPILGYVIGGAFTSIPVGVSGDIRSPLVVPLGPGAVGSEVLGIFERTFKLPGKMVEPLTSKSSDKPKK
jgi:uncharacterized protein involved in outer membrane biogenesis